MLILQLFNTPLPSLQTSCLRNGGAKNLCNQPQVSEFLETVLEKMVEITPEIVSRGHLEIFSGSVQTPALPREEAITNALIVSCTESYSLSNVNKTAFFLSVKSYDILSAAQFYVSLSRRVYTFFQVGFSSRDMTFSWFLPYFSTCINFHHKFYYYL